MRAPCQVLSNNLNTEYLSVENVTKLMIIITTDKMEVTNITFRTIYQQSLYTETELD